MGVKTHPTSHMEPTHAHTYIQTGTHMHRETDTHRDTERHTERHTYTHRKRQSTNIASWLALYHRKM